MVSIRGIDVLNYTWFWRRNLAFPTSIHRANARAIGLDVHDMDVGAWCNVVALDIDLFILKPLGSGSEDHC